MATGLVRLEIDGRGRAGRSGRAEGDAPLRVGLDDLLRAAARRGPGDGRVRRRRGGPAAARCSRRCESQEVWGAGVTYERSRDGRMEESTEGGVYDRIYVARRPEVFFKATAPRVVGPGQPVGVRADSPWNAPEPELGLVLNAAGEVFGYVIGNDVSSRSIEGENPLYLPQAKVYDRSCALGPAIVPVWAAPALPFDIALRVERGDDVAFDGSTSTASLTRSFEDLAALADGRARLPGRRGPADRHRHRARTSRSASGPGDVVTIDIAGLGTLTNPVVLVGRDLEPGGNDDGARTQARRRRRHPGAEELDRLVDAATAAAPRAGRFPPADRAAWLERRGGPAGRRGGRAGAAGGRRRPISARAG